ncbi:ArsR/SmtB family transcription factor [Actinoallomurus iriomotensis]|uniref:Transcriptional regulator n=1 Tax=Actinoallomurus iriomotensis TaxID=478107 RepID=A0A9W6S7X1_9ACTN|nr:helix-turn-helix transcriptional regulator [Actinoallomurus iriomotensis]GLY89985.1 transcriptional regulator [Actinoallomurus iriomotensis]
MFGADCDLTVVGRAIAEPARAAMLQRMMDGQAHTASALAAAARISPSAASAHLRHLVDANLAHVTRIGRRRLHALASPEVATAIEALAAISPPLPVESLREAQTGSRLQCARVCYSHLGGSLAVTITDQLVTAGIVDPLEQGRPGAVHGLAHPLLAALGVTRLTAGSGPAVRGCLDWTERVPHLAGRLGATLLTAMLARQWVTRRPNDRAVTITDTGFREFAELAIPLPRR